MEREVWEAPPLYSLLDAKVEGKVMSLWTLNAGYTDTYIDKDDLLSSLVHDIKVSLVFQVIEKYTRTITPVSPSEAEKKTQVAEESMGEAPTREEQPSEASTVIPNKDSKPV